MRSATWRTSFNRMSLQLRSANEEIVAWARTLEERVDQKTRELKRAHEQVLHIEKMATIGKMAAVVAHEINNPLSGILTYAKLIRKWIERGQVQAEKRAEAEQCLDLIAEESRRCGDLVKNLLTFSRTSPMNRAKHGCEYRGEPERQAHCASDGDEERRGARGPGPGSAASASAIPDRSNKSFLLCP